MRIPFVQSKNYSKGRRGKTVRLIVIHTMETPETKGRAKQVASWFAGKTAPDASAHYCIDDINVIITVDEKDTAWATGVSEVNQVSISLELAGQARQTNAQWQDKYSQGVLKNAAVLTATLCKKYNIPIKHLIGSSVKTGKGICGHADITKGYDVAGGHSDPGRNFPWSDFMELVQDETNRLKGKN